MGEFLNKFKSSLYEFWGGLEKGQKIRLVIASVLSIALVTGFVLYASRPKMSMLYTDITQTDAGEIYSRLKEMGVKSRIDGTTIYVPEEKVDELRAQFAVEGLAGEESGYPEDIEPSFYETSEDKYQRYLIMKQEKLKRGIKAIKGVDYVDVNLYIPQDSNFVLDSNRTEATASLIIKTKQGTAALDRNQVNGIVQYVSKSVKGLKPENVSIIDEYGRSLVADSTSPNAQVSSQMEMQEAVRTNIEESIEKFLEAPFGINNVKVKAAVKLDYNSVTENITTFEAPDEENNAGIVRNMQDIKKEWVDASGGGVPGTDSNTDITQYAEVDDSKASYSEASTVVNYEINEIQKQIVKELGSIQSLSVSVLINENSLREEALANTEELITKVKDLVKYSIQGFNAQASIVDNNINVAIMKFDTSLIDEINSAKEAEEAMKRRELIIMVATGIAAVLIFGAAMFLMLRKRKASYDEGVFVTDASGNQIPINTIQSDSIAEIDIEDKNEVKKKIEKFVGLKPETVAQLLKTWLNED